jgi:hypothetical protein
MSSEPPAIPSATVVLKLSIIKYNNPAIVKTIKLRSLAPASLKVLGIERFCDENPAWRQDGPRVMESLGHRVCTPEVVENLAETQDYVSRLGGRE